MRDQIADIIGKQTFMDSPSFVADAILEALPDMIAPLVWDAHPDDDEWYAVTSDSNYGPEMGYTVLKNSKGNFNVYMRSGDEKLGNLPTLEKAQDAANAHHRAAIMAAFTGETK
jgi:hypothetical protein